MIMFMILLGTFLVNSFLDLVLFDSSASRSLVSQSFSRGFDMPIGELECPLQISIANKHRVSASSVYQGYVLDNFRVPYLIDMIPIPMGVFV